MKAGDLVRFDADIVKKVLFPLLPVDVTYNGELE